MKKIVALADDLFFYSKIEELTKMFGFETDAVANVSEIVEKAEHDIISVILLDMNSKIFNPIEVIREIKFHAAINRIPIIGYMHPVDLEKKHEAERLGCEQVLSREQLKHKMDSILEAYSGK